MRQITAEVAVEIFRSVLLLLLLLLLMLQAARLLNARAHDGLDKMCAHLHRVELQPAGRVAAGLSRAAAGKTGPVHLAHDARRRAQAAAWQAGPRACAPALLPRQPQLFALLLLPEVDLFDAGAAQDATPLLAVDRNEDGIGGGGGGAAVVSVVVFLIVAGGGGSAGTKVFVKGENLNSKVVVFHAQRVAALKIF